MCIYGMGDPPVPRTKCGVVMTPGKSATHGLAVRRGKIATPKVSPKKEQKND